jgi:hypothetical protein
MRFVFIHEFLEHIKKSATEGKKVWQAYLISKKVRFLHGYIISVRLVLVKLQ